MGRKRLKGGYYTLSLTQDDIDKLGLDDASQAGSSIPFDTDVSFIKQLNELIVQDGVSYVFKKDKVIQLLINSNYYHNVIIINTCNAYDDLLTFKDESENSIVLEISTAGQFYKFTFVKEF